MKAQVPRVLTFILTLASIGLVSSAYGAQRDNNLFEYSFGSYGDGGGEHNIPMLWPPLVKIYQDGKVVFYVKADNKFYVGQIEPGKLIELKTKLARQSYLRQSRYIDMKGDFVNIHGGLSYIRYLDADNAVLLSTEVRPRGGTWKKMVDLVRSFLPATYALFVPDKIGLQVWEDKSAISQPSPVVWPYSKEIRISSKPETISSPGIIRYLFEHLEGSFSFFAWDFMEDGKRMSIVLENAPGWYNDGDLKFALAQLTWEWNDKQKTRKGPTRK